MSFAIRTAPAVAAGLQRYVRNTVIISPGPGYQYDAIEEFWFPTEAEMLTAREALARQLETGPIGPRQSRLLTSSINMQKRLPPLPLKA